MLKTIVEVQVSFRSTGDPYILNRTVSILTPLFDSVLIDFSFITYSRNLERK